MKYDFSLEYGVDNASTKILNLICSNSTVLEVGCASGRMTKYMRDVMQCKVYIIEIEQEAYDKAKDFAVDGKCCDIEKMSLENLFKGSRFDYILFVDVLEHLHDPGETLNKCKKLLNKDGEILISIPNISHNSIISELYNNNFSYKNLGILDNTHLKFFTLNSAKNLFETCDYHILHQDAVYVNMLDTEFGNNFNNIPLNLLFILNQRELGLAYQYIFALGLEKKFIVNNFITTKEKHFEIFKLYYSYDGRYSEDNCITKSISLGENQIAFNLNHLKGLQNIRIDCVEGESCIALHQVIINNELVNINGSNAYLQHKNIYLFKNDPQFYLDVSGNNTVEVEIHFSVDVVWRHNVYFDVNDIVSDLEQKNNMISQSELQLYEQSRKIEEQSRKIEEQNRSIGDQKSLISNYQNDFVITDNALSCAKNQLSYAKRHKLKAIIKLMIGKWPKEVT